MYSSVRCGLIKKQFPLFFAKIDKIAYTYNSKDAKHSNRNNLLYDGDFWAVEFQYAIRIFKGAKGVAMATKFKQK